MLSARSIRSARGRKIWVRVDGDDDDRALGIRVAEDPPTVADLRRALVSVASFDAYGVKPDSITADTIEVFVPRAGRLEGPASPTDDLTGAAGITLVLRPAPSLLPAAVDRSVSREPSAPRTPGSRPATHVPGPASTGPIAPSTPESRCSVAPVGTVDDCLPMQQPTARTVRDAIAEVKESSDWRKQCEGLTTLRRLLAHHHRLIRPSTGPVVSALQQGLRSQRQGAVRLAALAAAPLLALGTGLSKGQAAMIDPLLPELCRVAETAPRASTVSAAAAALDAAPAAVLLRVPSRAPAARGAARKVLDAAAAELQSAPLGPLSQALHVLRQGSSEDRSLAGEAGRRLVDVCGGAALSSAAASALSAAHAAALCEEAGALWPPPATSVPRTPSRRTSAVRSATALVSPTIGASRPPVNLANTTAASRLLRQRAAGARPLALGSERGWDTASRSSRLSIRSFSSSIGPAGATQKRGVRAASSLAPTDSPPSRPALGTPAGSPMSGARPAPPIDHPLVADELADKLKRQHADRDRMIQALVAENQDLKREKNRLASQDGVTILTTPDFGDGWATPRDLVSSPRRSPVQLLP
eukprot:TRINITY_DN5498_c0_g1_i1.p1 TRINITY_DN5498_c0_g1~~TRINITY_DN5498_c0_g1_i1.p1  ORF type:complete len:587 (+),score=112.13 TRINITY_DN5498_c0_g1_i1:67-1827(+)